MRPSKFTEDEIVGALRQVRDGTPAVQICRQLGITETTFYRWRSKHDDLGRIEPREMREGGQHRKIKTTGRRPLAEPALGYWLFGVAVG